MPLAKANLLSKVFIEWGCAPKVLDMLAVFILKKRYLLMIEYLKRLDPLSSLFGQQKRIFQFLWEMLLVIAS